MGIRKPSGTLGEGIAPLRGSVLRLGWEQTGGLVAAMDDGTMTAYVHYLLVHPRYQGCGVGSVVAGYVQKTLCRVFAHSSHFLQGKGSFLRKEWFPSGPDAGGYAFDSSYVRRNRD